jgi:hypothetical protein
LSVREIQSRQTSACYTVAAAASRY